MSEDSLGEEQKLNPKLETILKEHWEHARFCEYEMILFTSIYGAIVAGALVFMSRMDYKEPINFALASLLSLFLLGLSALGFGVVISQSLGHHNYILNVLMILDCWKKTRFYKNPKKPCFLKKSCRQFYEITIAFFGILFVYYAFFPSDGKIPDTVSFGQVLLLIVIFLSLFASIEKLYQWKWEIYSIKRRLFMAALRKSKGEFCKYDNWDEQLENKNSQLWKDIRAKLGSDEQYAKLLKKVFP
ncbi:MAG: hypothetical protein AYK18_09365 [Theionarchaea archaeon DG-70]|nr:MAG: hypothetical protein AYK18_09365 [Theionarchaea archaeon DG-70]